MVYSGILRKGPDCGMIRDKTCQYFSGAQAKNKLLACAMQPEFGIGKKSGKTSERVIRSMAWQVGGWLRRRGMGDRWIWKR